MKLIKKLAAAFRKATKRANARLAESKVVTKKVRRKNKEIKALRGKLDSFVKSHKKALAELEHEKDPKRQKQLRDAIKKQEDEITKIVHAIQQKVGRRGELKVKARKAQKRARWWLVRKGKTGKKLKAAKAEWEKDHGTPVFETWMLNGCPSNIDEDLKPVLAFNVVVCGQYITATTNGTHTPSSNHYPWNWGDNEGHAFDSGQSSVGSMQEAMIKTVEHFGQDKFLEYFGPVPWYIKDGVKLAIFPYFPGHGNHGHCAVA